jgi:hypothetical protein
MLSFLGPSTSFSFKFSGLLQDPILRLWQSFASLSLPFLNFSYNQAILVTSDSLIHISFTSRPINMFLASYYSQNLSDGGLFKTRAINSTYDSSYTYHDSSSQI